MSMPDRWKRAGLEPSMAEMMADPLVQMVMARDRIGSCAIERAVNQARAQIISAKSQPASPVRNVA